MKTTKLTAGKKAWITRRKNLNKVENLTPAQKAWVTRKKNTGKKVKVFEDNKACSGKEIVRMYLEKFTIESAEKFGIKRGIVPTLSATKCRMERILNQNEILRELKYIPIEMGLKNFRELGDNIKKEKWGFMQQPIHSKFFDVIKNFKEDSCAHVFADFCKTFITHEKDVITILAKNMVVVGGNIWITVSQRGCKGTYNKLKTLIKSFDNYEILDIPKAYAKYRDGGGMVSIVIRRVK